MATKSSKNFAGAVTVKLRGTRNEKDFLNVPTYLSVVCSSVFSETFFYVIIMKLADTTICCRKEAHLAEML